MNKESLRDQLHRIIEKSDERFLRMVYALAKSYFKKPEASKNNPTKREEGLYRLVYTSARTKSCTDEEVEKILEASRRNNKKANVSGILVSTSDRFLQVLEGEKETVMALYQKIEKDARHGGSNMRFCEPVDQRYFEEWDMASKPIDSSSLNYKTAISAKRKAQYESMLDGDVQSYKDEGMRVLKTFFLVE